VGRDGPERGPAVQVVESCIFTADEEKGLRQETSSGTLKEGGPGDTKIMIWDHTRPHLKRDPRPRMKTRIRPDISGAPLPLVHRRPYDNVRMVHDAFPDKHLHVHRRRDRGQTGVGRRLGKT